MKPFITLILLCNAILVCLSCSEAIMEPLYSTHDTDHGGCIYDSQELLTDPGDSLEPETISMPILPSQVPQPLCTQSDEYNVYLDPGQVFAEVSFCSLDSFAYYLKTTFVIIWKVFFYWMHYSFAGSWNRTYFQWRLFWVTRESIYWFGEEESRGEGWLSPPDLIEIDWWTWRATDGDMDKSEKWRVLRPSPPTPLHARNCTSALAPCRRKRARCCKPNAADMRRAAPLTPILNATSLASPKTVKSRNVFNQPLTRPQTGNAKNAALKIPQ